MGKLDYCLNEASKLRNVWKAYDYFNNMNDKYDMHLNGRLVQRLPCFRLYLVILRYSKQSLRKCKLLKLYNQVINGVAYCSFFQKLESCLGSSQDDIDGYAGFITKLFVRFYFLINWRTSWGHEVQVFKSKTCEVYVA